MRRRVVTSRRADEDVVRAIEHFPADAALAFVDGLELAWELLAEYPAIGSARFAIETGIPQLRSVALPRMPDLVFYTDDFDAVRIQRVLHTRQDIPGELAE